MVVIDAIIEGRGELNFTVMEIVMEWYETMEDNFHIKNMVEDRTPSVQGVSISVEGPDGVTLAVDGPGGDAAQGYSVRGGERMRIPSG